MAKQSPFVYVVIIVVGLIVLNAVLPSNRKLSSVTTSTVHGGSSGGGGGGGSSTDSQPVPEPSFTVVDEQGEEITKIDLGTIPPGGSKTVPVYFKSDFNYTAFYANGTNFQPPEAGKYFNVSLDGPALTVTVSPDIQNITNFSFDVVITGVWV